MKLMTVFWTTLCVAFLSACNGRQERQVSVNDLTQHDNAELLDEARLYMGIEHEGRSNSALKTAYYYATTHF